MSFKSFFKRCFPNAAVLYVRECFSAIDMLFLGLVEKFGFFSSFYYIIVNNGFSREQKAVLSGRAEFRRTQKFSNKSNALLRRNVHRLEKGIIMRPRRECFGEGYIKETVQALIKASQFKDFCVEEGKWAVDVIDNYFSIVSPVGNIRDAKMEFYNWLDLEKHEPVRENLLIPYQSITRVKSGITFSELQNLFLQRRSVRWYEDKPVPLELIKNAVDIATLSPSACNRIPYRFYIANEKEKAVKLAACAMGTAGFYQNLPCVIAVVGDLSFYPYERDRHCIYIDASLATMQLMLALETLGLSTCAINWPEIEEREKMLEKLVGLRTHERTIMLLAVGYADPDGGIPYSQKKKSEVLVEVL